MTLPRSRFCRLLIVAGVLVWPLFCFSALAGNKPGDVLTMEQAVAVALEHNHEIKAVQSALAAGRADIGIARSNLLPRISFEERFLRTNNPGWAFMSRLNQSRIEAQDFNPALLNSPDAINDFQSSISVEQPVFVGKALVGLKMSRTEALAREEELRQKREEVAFAVVTACLNILTAKEYHRVAKIGVEEATERLRIATVRYENDVGHYADLLRASTSLTEARQKLNVTATNVTIARRALGVLLAINDLPDVTDAEVDFTLKEPDYYIQAAQNRPDLRAFELRADNARHNVRMAQAGFFPSIGVGGSYYLHDHNLPLGSEGKSWQVSAFLRWDLFEGTKRIYEGAKARHQEAQARQQLAAVKDGVSFKIHKAYLNVEEARSGAGLARQALETAQEGARILQLRYENGLTSLGELLNVQTTLEMARAGVVEKNNAYKTSLAVLSFESGILLKDLNIDDNR